MAQRLGSVALLVPEYDPAIAYFTQSLGFALVSDTAIAGEPGKRWVVVAPPGSSDVTLILAKATTPAQISRIGDQAGGRVFLFLQTDDFWRDYRAYLSRGVDFLEQPRTEPYGTVVVFRDYLGNKWDLLELKKPA
jgi:catechol 2,3-dioxygenase-like lactoylglutathione lyase family enzyme